MTISTTNGINLYNGNGSTTVFPYVFKITDETHLQVIHTSAALVETVKTLSTHYTVSGVGAASGNVTYIGTPIPSGEKLTIKRIVPLTQLTDLENQGNVSAEVNEDKFDELTMMAIQQQEELNRCPKVDVSSGDTGAAYLTTIQTAVTAAQLAQANAETAETAAELAETNAAADLVSTNADVVSTNADVVSTNADAAATALDKTATNADVVLTAADAVSTAADEVLTNADTILTAADAAATALDKTATNADVVTTNADVVLTNADAVLTAADVVSTAADAAALSTHLTATEDMSNKTFTDALTFTEITTPSTPASGDRKIFPKADGKFYQVNDAGLETEMGSGGAGSSTTIHLIKAKDASDTDFTIKSIDDVLPDFDGTDTLGATFSVPSSGSEALLSNDDDHAVYKFATAASSQYDAQGLPFAIPRYARGRDVLLEFQYRTADTSGASANGDYMVWIVDDTNMVNTTTTSTGAQAAGSSLVVGTSTGMAVGDKIWIGETGGTTQVTEAHITAIADSTHVTLSEAVTLTSGDRLVTGVLSDVLTTLNAADSDTNLEGASFKKYVQVPATCASIKFLVQQLTTQTDSFLYFDNILIDSDPFKKVSTFTNSAITEKFLSSTSTSAADLADLTFTNLIIGKRYLISGLVSFDSLSSVQNGIAYYSAASGGGTLYGKTSQDSLSASTVTSGFNASIEFEAVSTTLYCNQLGGVNLYGDGTKAATFIQLKEVPQEGTAIIVESADSVMSDPVAYTPTGTWTTNTSYTGKWSRDGKFMDGEVYVSLTGAPTSADLKVELPLGYQVDESAMVGDSGNTRRIDGGVWILDNGVINYVGIPTYKLGDSTTTITLQTQNASGTYLSWSAITQIAPQTFATGDRVLVTFRVPIAGWSAVNKPLIAIPTVSFGQNAEQFEMDNATAAFWDATGSIETFDVSLLPLTGSNLIEYNDTTQTRIVAKARIKITLSITGNLNAGNLMAIKDKNGVKIGFDQCEVTGRYATGRATTILETGDYLYGTNESASTQYGGLTITVEPELGQQNHAAIISAPVAFVEDHKANDTNGGTSSATPVARDLNWISGDIAAVDISLTGTDGFTLNSAGRYLIEWSAPAFQAAEHMTALYNETTSSYIEYGTGEYAGSTDASITRSFGQSLVTITSATEFAIFHEVASSTASNGWGVKQGANLSLCSGDEVFTQVKITRKS
tara:strand:+ start:35472 stop:39056 length:3585 start_codon:yes stop_codon:yes gene_type:complete